MIKNNTPTFPPSLSTFLPISPPLISTSTPALAPASPHPFSRFPPSLYAFQGLNQEVSIELTDYNILRTRVRFDSGVSEPSTMLSGNSSTSSSRDDFALCEVDKDGLRLVDNVEKQSNKGAKFTNLSSFNQSRSFFSNSTESFPRGFFSSRSTNFQLSQSVPVASNLSLATMSTMFAPSTDDINVDKSSFWNKRQSSESEKSENRFKKRSNEDFVSCRMTKDGFVVMPPK